MTGSRRSIVAVLACSLSVFWPGAMIFGFPGVMGPYWQEMFGVGEGATGNILFFILVATGIFMFFAGRWQEKYGIRFMINSGTLLCSLSVFLVAYARNIYFIYLWAFLVGASSGFIYIPALTTVQLWYEERRGLVSGIVSLIFGISAAIMSPFFSSMLHSMGYIKMSLLIAAISLVVGLAAARYMEMPERIEAAVSAGPQSQSPVAGEGSSIWGRSMTVQESIRTRSFWFLWLIWALQGAAGIAMVNLSVSFGLARGFALGSAVAILTTFNLMNGFSRILTGYLSDLIGRNLTMSLTFFAAGGAYLILPYLHNLTALAILAGVIGLSFGTLFSVSAPLVSDCFGLKHFGAILGLTFTAYGFVAGILGPSLSGYILDVTKGNYFIVFIYLGIFCLLSAVLIWGVVVPYRMGPASRAKEGSSPSQA
ncbi:MAG: OFA family MFS transporter [Firmicutes bacterium]|nr:OFA family MFS transporter [Bacillota bacterium]